MTTYRFTIYFGGTFDRFDRTDALLDRLFNAGCDDATVEIRESVLLLRLSYEGYRLSLAVGSAIDAIERADVGHPIVRIEIERGDRP